MRRIGATVLVLLFLSACTHDNGSTQGIASAATAAPTASPSAANAAAMQQFAQCMSGHGVTVTREILTPPSGGPDSAAGRAWNTAMNACRSILPAEVLQPNPDPAELEQLRAFAVCMRAHDIPMTDPLPNGNMRINGRFEHVTRTQLDADPVYIAAMTACRDKLPVANKSAEPKR